MTEQEEKVIQILDTLCFKSANHLKRGQGIIIFPIKTIYKCDYFLKFNLAEYVSGMFKRRFTTQDKNT